MTLSEQALQDYARKAVEKPFEFEYQGEYPLFSTWGLSPFSHHARCSDEQTAIFHDISQQLILQYPQDFAIEAFDHYAMEWIEFLLVRVYDEQGGVTPAFSACLEFLAEWNRRMASEPVQEPQDPMPEEPLEEVEPMEVAPQPAPEPRGDGVTDIARDIVYPVFVRFGTVDLNDQQERFDVAHALAEAFAKAGYAVSLNYIAYILDDPRVRNTDTSKPDGVTTLVDFVAVEMKPYTD